MLASHQMQVLAPFGVLAVNTMFFGLLRGMIGRPMDPNFIQWVLLEFVATMELCADCAELDVIYDLHGTVVYGLTLFILCFLWGQAWFKAVATPCDPIEDIILQQEEYKTIAARFIGQLLAVALAYRYASLIWSYKFIPEHKKYYTTHCENPMQVSVFMGFMIEAGITMISRFVQLETSHLDRFKEGFINSLTTVVLVLAALDTTGGFFNPALASALKFNCSGSVRWKFFTVYWVGAVTGDLVAKFMHSAIHKPPPQEQPAARRNSSPANLNEHRHHESKPRRTSQ